MTAERPKDHVLHIGQNRILRDFKLDVALCGAAPSHWEIIIPLWFYQDVDFAEKGVCRKCSELAGLATLAGLDV